MVWLTKSAQLAPDDTKAKIMVAAFELFGRHGFAGASIRRIAHEAGVNLAAVNYHFKNKENLFWELMTLTFNEVDGRIAVMAADSESTVELAEKIYDFFIEESLAVKNTMKMMLTEGILPPGADNSVLAGVMGPPGGEHIAKIIQRDIPYKLRREGQLWGVKAVFGSIFHWALLVSTERLCHPEVSNDPLMSEAQFKKDVLLMVESSVSFLRLQRKRFEDK